MPIEISPSPENPHRFQRRGFSCERAIKYFFASNAGLTLVILLLIIVFLLKEGLGFFPGYRRELEIYRIAGLEFVDISRKNLTAHEQLSSVLNRAYFAQINGQCARELKRSQEAAAVFNAFSDQTSATRELIANHEATGMDRGSEMLATLNNNHACQKQKALDSLPLTPHLSDTERAELIESIRARDVTTVGDPPLVTALAQQYASAQQQCAMPIAEWRSVIDSFEAAGADLSALVTEMTDAVTTTKEAIQNNDILENDRKSLLAAAANAKDPSERQKLMAEARDSLAEKPDIEGPMQSLMLRKPDCIATHAALRQACEGILAMLPPSLSQSDANRLLLAARKASPLFLEALTGTSQQITQWRHDKPVPLSDSIRSFLTGKDWVTGGAWQDFYGILPLLAGSLMISMVALCLAIPAGVGAAIYINQFASPVEQAVVKPVIEFIAAIPSVVLGFIGILIFGTILRDLSQLDGLAWVPGFPIEERLNIFTAGCLLALMSIPTIFSLAEDALNNVPAAFSEASDALGASRIQTTFRVIIPAAFSGILAAVLLGLGRVIGETMVVLLVAGNRIKIPDFSAGLGTFFQPSHTLTGIIAQELGEVPLGSVHYRALFVVGILLFAVVLGINATAHKFVNRTTN
jgi:phosphate transport system permease protein